MIESVQEVGMKLQPQALGKFRDFEGGEIQKVNVPVAQRIATHVSERASKKNNSSLGIRDEPYLVLRDDLRGMRAIGNYPSRTIQLGAGKTIVELVEADQRRRGNG